MFAIGLHWLTAATALPGVLVAAAKLSDAFARTSELAK